MKHTLYRNEGSKLGFFTGTTAQCLWKLLRHVVNIDTVLVDNKDAVEWIRELSVKSFRFKTSKTGFEISFKGAGDKNILPAILRAEKKFATTF